MTDWVRGLERPVLNSRGVVEGGVGSVQEIAKEERPAFGRAVAPSVRLVFGPN